MAPKKDKEKVIDPVWDETRIREFLTLLAPAGENTDHHRLLKAYQSMRAEDFADFITYFVEAGGNLNAINKHEETVSDIIATHRYGKPYLEAIKRYL